MTAFEECFNRSEHLLLEGALGERLKREYGIPFDRHLDMGGLVERPSYRKALGELWSGYRKIADKYHMPFMATTPTRRTNRERIAMTSFQSSIIHSNVKFLKEVRDSGCGEMYIGALLGCHGDAYTGTGCLDREKSLDFHSWETQLFAEEEIDFFLAGLMPDAEEALGLSQAVCRTGLPYIISFTLQKDGCLPDGTRLNDAIEYIDSNADRKPLCYMTNCVHPTIVMEALAQDFNGTDAVKERFLGIQANTSARSFAQLDGSAILHSSAPETLARDMKELSDRHFMKIVGGCCGTDYRHLEEIARAFTQK